MDYTDFLVRNCPRSAMYIPNFITSDEEQRILKQVENAPKPKWTQLSRRRLINYGGIPHPNGMIAEAMPVWLQDFIDKVNNLGIFESLKANHVLVNEYLAGQGIMPHTDGPLFYPTISTISCGSHTVLEFQKAAEGETASAEHSSACPKDIHPSDRYKRQTCCKLLVEPRSLLILKDSLYHEYLHSISEIEEDLVCDDVCNLDNCATAYKFGDRLQRKTRISLTIRHVPKTSRMKLKFSTTGSWNKDFSSPDVEHEARVPVKILDLRAGSREINFSTIEAMDNFRLHQTVLFQRRIMEECFFEMGCVSPNTWKATIEAAPEVQMMPDRI